AVLIPRELASRADERLRGASAAVAAVRDERLERAARDVARIVRILAALPPAVRAAHLDEERLASGLDFLSLGPAISARPVRFAGGVPASPAAALDARGGVERVSSRMPAGPALQGGWFVDDAYAERLSRAAGVGIVVRSGDRILGSASRAQGSRSVALPAGDATILLVAPAASGVGAFLFVIGVVALGGLGVATLLGFAIARALARPLRDLSDQALAIAGGDLNRRVRATGRDEVARLGRAFNEMAASVQAHVEEIRASRDELRRTLERLGSTLRSTRGMEEMLGAVLEAAVTTLGAAGGALFRMHPGGALYVEAQVGLEAALSTREVASIAAHEGRPVLGSALDGDDPLGRSVVAAPLHRNGDVIGVVALCGPGEPSPFDDRDLSTLASFAAQASVAIDNVFLREEAERLALTDPLTGVPNRRAMERLLESEAERAVRYGTKTTVLMIDLDHFKDVNDRFGHMDGDRVLVETCRRIGATVRAGVDTLARYGGEEFVLILPETPPAGGVTVAEKILRAMSAHPFPIAGGRRVTVSIGVACLPGDGPGADDALHAADMALYRAKQGGRNCVVPTAAAEQEVART
ncbi:MAG: diguanylate cyclase, partial [Actinomycetota bacterium]